MFLFLILAIVISVYAFNYINKDDVIERKSKDNELEKLVDELVIKHQKVLQRKYKQTHYVDEYGTTCENGWKQEIAYFIERVIEPQCDHGLNELDKMQLSFLINMKLAMLPLTQALEFSDKVFEFSESDEGEINYEDIVDKEDIDIPSLQKREIRTGIDYENYIETILKDGNFIINRTPTTGDQGVDLIATKDNVRIAIQCKFYSKPVGNKAVQEVIAGKDYYECEYACVVSNNTYTPAAKKLASISNVLLLNDDNIIEKFNQTFGFKTKSKNKKINMEMDKNDSEAIKLLKYCADLSIKFKTMPDNLENCIKSASLNTLIFKVGKMLNIEDIRTLIERGFDFNARIYNEMTLFELMCRNGNYEIVKALIKAGADMNAQNEFGCTPLMGASIENNIGAIKALIEAGANINIQNDDGKTALMIATQRKNTEVIELLTKAKARGGNIGSNTQKTKYSQISNISYQKQDDDTYETEENDPEESDNDGFKAEELFFTDLTPPDDPLKIK